MSCSENVVQKLNIRSLSLLPHSYFPWICLDSNFLLFLSNYLSLIHIHKTSSAEGISRLTEILSNFYKNKYFYYAKMHKVLVYNRKVCHIIL